MGKSITWVGQLRMLYREGFRAGKLLLDEICREKFDPVHLQYMQDSNLKHPDSFITI